MFIDSCCDILLISFVALKFILDGSQFTEKQILHLEIARTLCIWCGVDSPVHRRKLGIEMDVDQSFIKSKLVKVLEKLESHKGFDLSLVSTEFCSCVNDESAKSIR